MEKNNHLDATDNTSIIKRIFLYMNVTAFRIFNRNTIVSDYKSSRSFGFNAMIIAVSEFAVAKYILPHSISFYRVYIFIAVFIIHLTIDWFFMKSITTMAESYTKYYSKFLFYIFFVFLAIGLVGALLTINDEIGHVRK